MSAVDRIWGARRGEQEKKDVVLSKAEFHYSSQLQTWFSTRFAAKFSTSWCWFATCFRPAFNFFCWKTGCKPQQVCWFVHVLDKWNVEKPILSKFAAGFRPACYLLATRFSTRFAAGYNNGMRPLLESVVTVCIGYIPRWQYKFGRTYKNECGECIDEFEAMQHLKDCDMLSSLAYPKPLPNLQSVMSDSNVRDYLNELQNSGCKLTCLSRFYSLRYVSETFCYLHDWPYTVAYIGWNDISLHCFFLISVFMPSGLHLLSKQHVGQAFLCILSLPRNHLMRGTFNFSGKSHWRNGSFTNVLLMLLLAKNTNQKTSYF